MDLVCLSEDQQIKDYQKEKKGVRYTYIAIHVPRKIVLLSQTKQMLDSGIYKLFEMNPSEFCNKMLTDEEGKQYRCTFYERKDIAEKEKTLRLIKQCQEIGLHRIGVCTQNFSKWNVV